MVKGKSKNVYELEMENERIFGEQRRERIRRDNEIMKKRIEKKNALAKAEIDKEFKRRCRAVKLRERELEERGLRMTKRSPFKCDDYRVMVRKNDLRREKDKKEQYFHDISLSMQNMTGSPSFDPISKEFIEGLDPQNSNALRLRTTRQRLRVTNKVSLISPI